MTPARAKIVLTMLRFSFGAIIFTLALFVCLIIGQLINDHIRVVSGSSRQEEQAARLESANRRIDRLEHRIEDVDQRVTWVIDHGGVR